MKHDAKNNLVKAKTQFIMQGFSQALGIDFSKTFTPTANSKSIQIIFALTTWNGWPVHQADYKNAYLNAKFDETIYIKL
jgi:hypothetical protein